jgi:hypothetical protein
MIKAELFLIQANKLIDPSTNPTEVDFRSAISRAYYALYHETYPILEKKHRPKIIKFVKEELDRRKWTNIDGIRLNNLEKSYLNALAINYHRILSQVLGVVDFELSQSFKESRADRDNADYDLNLTYTLPESTARVNEVGETIKKIKKL